MYYCNCGVHKEQYKGYLAHTARCKVFIDRKNEILEAKKDEILKLHANNSVLQIVNIIGKSEYISHSSVSNKLKEWGIQTRNISESQMLLSTKNRRAETNIKLYGGTGNALSAGSSILERRNNTIIEKYGVSNIYASDWFSQHVTNNEQFWLDRHGMTRKEVWHKAGLTIWNSYSEEERTRRIKNANNKMFLRERTKSCTISTLEKEALDVLEELYDIIRQKWISGNSIVRCYDAYILNTKILIEINGDYWHANPKIYKSGDIINFPGNNHMIVDEIWAKDRFKKELAESYGYKIIVFWESEIKQTTDLSQLFLNRIENENY